MHLPQRVVLVSRNWVLSYTPVEDLVPISPTTRCSANLVLNGCSCPQPTVNTAQVTPSRWRPLISRVSRCTTQQAFVCVTSLLYVRRVGMEHCVEPHGAEQQRKGGRGRAVVRGEENEFFSGERSKDSNARQRRTRRSTIARKGG